MGKRLTNENVKRLVKKADDELQGQLSFDDFKNFYKFAGEIEKRDEDIKQAFVVFDNGSGKGLVDVKTLRHALTQLGDKMTEQEVSVILLVPSQPVCACVIGLLHPFIWHLCA